LPLIAIVEDLHPIPAGPDVAIGIVDHHDVDILRNGGDSFGDHVADRGDHDHRLAGDRRGGGGRRDDRLPVTARMVDPWREESRPEDHGGLRRSKRSATRVAGCEEGRRTTGACVERRCRHPLVSRTRATFDAWETARSTGIRPAPYHRGEAMRVTVVCGALASNGIARPWILAQLLSRHHDVEAIGALRRGEEIWPGLADYPWQAVPVDGTPSDVRRLEAAITGEVV